MTHLSKRRDFPAATGNKIVAEVEAAHESLKRCLDSMDRILIGQEAVNRLTLVGILAGGHIMLTGKPGLGKTELLSNLAEIVGLGFSRIQGVSDLMPGDIIGFESDNRSGAGNEEFAFRRGPIFSQLVMFDEINRAPPRTQSALLQAMQEKSVTVDGKSVSLQRLFHVVATRNPIEQEGTYPLPEAQMDRFIMDIPIKNTTAANERKIVQKILAADKAEKAAEKAEAVLTASDLIKYQALVRNMPIGEDVLDGLINVVRACRPDDDKAHKDIRSSILVDPSGSRAQASFALAANALALINGRFAASKSDIAALAHPILGHRMSLSYQARARGAKLEELIDGVLERELSL